MDMHTLIADPPTADDYASLRRRVADGNGDAIAPLAELATMVRRDIVTTIDRAGLGHIGGDLSVTDILVTLYGAVLDVDPRDPLAPRRDRFVLSKGHCAVALYSTLARCGFFSPDELA